MLLIINILNHFRSWPNLIFKVILYTGLTLLGISSLFSQVNAQNTINVNGNVKNQFGANQENVKASFVDPLTNNIVDFAYTNAQGNYDKNFVWTGNNNNEENLEAKINAYPNPYTSTTNIEIATPKNDLYTLKVFDVQSKTLMNTQLSLNQGINTITLNGGNQGIHLITLENDSKRETYKIIQLENTGIPFTAHVLANQAPKYKSTLDGITDGAELRIEYTKPGYEPKDTTIIVHLEQTINQTIQQIPYTFTTTLLPFLETGEPITSLRPDFTVTVNWADGTNQTYQIENNQINITKDLYVDLNGSLGTAWINNDTTGINGVQNWSIIRQPHQRTNRPNIAQNETTEGVLVPDYQTQIPLDSLNGKTLHYYTIKKRAETQPGIYEALDGTFSKGLILSSGGVLGASTFIDLAPFGVADSLDLVRFGFNVDNNVPNTSTQQARLDNLFQQAINLRYLPNGDTLLPPHRIYTISTFSDPRWQEVVARGFENMVYTTYYNGTPENGKVWASDYTYNGKLRLKNTNGYYNIFETDGNTFSENFSAVTGEDEGVGGLSGYIWNQTMSEPTEYAKSISTIPALLNLGTGQDLKNNSAQPKELYSVSAQGEEPVFFNDLKTATENYPDVFYPSFEYNYTK